jgi:signal transduction histidine kinase
MFERLSPAYPGTGVGLALVRKVVERMEGQVGVETGAEGGSRFWLEFAKAAATASVAGEP